MPYLKLAVFVLLSFAVVGPAHANNTTPRGFLKPITKSLGNNSDLGSRAGRNAWAQKSRSGAEDYVRNEYRKSGNQQRWQPQQQQQQHMTRNKRQSHAKAGVND